MFKFAWPWIFLLLPLPWIIQRYLKPADASEDAALHVPFYQSVSQLIKSNSPSWQTNSRRQLLTFFAWILLLMAAANPQWLGAPVEVTRSGRDIMLALDLSGSMRIKDMSLHGRPTNRLAIVKSVARQFIRQREGDRLGLILFGTRAYLQTPFTFDRHTVETMLDDATIGLPGPRTAIGDAIGLAVKRFQKTSDKSRVLILLTDGSNNSGVLPPIQAAELAANQHIKIYTIGLGANQLIVNGLLGQRILNPSADLDEKTLEKISTLTGGVFFRAKDTKSLQKIYKTIDKLEPVSKDKTIFRPITSLFYWPLSFFFLITLFSALQKTLSVSPINLRRKGVTDHE